MVYIFRRDGTEMRPEEKMLRKRFKCIKEPVYTVEL